MERVTKNFTLEELTKGETFPEKVLVRLRGLIINVLQPVRDHFKAAVIISSGARTVAHNQAIGGAALSQHLFGEAADIKVKGVSDLDVFAFIRDNLEFDQLIYEIKGNTTWIHVSYVANRQMAIKLDVTAS